MPPPNLLKYRRTRDTVFRLIEEVKNRRLLWDPADDEYMDREATATAWQDISDILSSAGDGIEGDIKLKWKGLRDTYRRLQRSNAKRTVTVKWPYVKALGFLQGITKPKAPPDNPAEYLDTEMIEEEAEESQSQPYEYIKCEGTSDVDQENFTAPEFELDTLVERGEDHNLMFLKSLLPYFKSLEPMRQLIVRNKMQDILLNELAAQITTKGSSSNKENKKT